MLKEIKILTLFAFCGLALAQNRQLHGNSDEIMFPGEINSRFNEPKRSSSGLSLKLARMLNSVDTVEEFLKMINVVPKNREVLIRSRFGGEERSNGEEITPAFCTPELQTVSLRQDNHDPSITYLPSSCTRIMRCGGCCNHEQLSCQPKTMEMKNFVVTTMKIDPNGDGYIFGQEIIPLEEHTSCTCDCRIKAEHCTGKQKYDIDGCSCECTNEDEAEKCRQSNATKEWDPIRCACECRVKRDCTSGYYFDPISCRCQQQRWFNVGAGTSYDSSGKSKPRDSSLPVVPFGSDNRRRQNKDDPEYK